MESHIYAQRISIMDLKWVCLAQSFVVGVRVCTEFTLGVRVCTEFTLGVRVYGVYAWG